MKPELKLSSSKPNLHSPPVIEIEPEYSEKQATAGGNAYKGRFYLSDAQADENSAKKLEPMAYLPEETPKVVESPSPNAVDAKISQRLPVSLSSLKLSETPKGVYSNPVSIEAPQIFMRKFEVTNKNELVCQAPLSLPEKDKTFSVLRSTYEDNLQEQDVELYNQAVAIFGISLDNFYAAPSNYDILINIREYRYKVGKSGLMSRARNERTGVVVSYFDDERFEQAKNLAMDYNYKEKLNSGAVVSGTQNLKNRILNRTADDDWTKEFHLRLTEIANKYTVHQFDEILENICIVFDNFAAAQKLNNVPEAETEQQRIAYANKLCSVLFNKACMERPFVQFYVKLFDTIMARKRLSDKQIGILNQFFKQDGPDMLVTRLREDYIDREILHARSIQKDFVALHTDDARYRAYKEYNARFHYKGCCRFVAHLFACGTQYIPVAFMLQVVFNLIEQELMDYPNDRRISDRLQKEFKAGSGDAGIKELLDAMTKQTHLNKDECIIEAIDNYAVINARIQEFVARDELEAEDYYKLSVIQCYFYRLKYDPRLAGELAAFKIRSLQPTKKQSVQKRNVISFVLFPGSDDFKEIKQLWDGYGLLHLVYQFYYVDCADQLVEKLKGDVSLFRQFVCTCFEQNYSERLIRDKYQLFQVCGKALCGELYNIVLFRAVEYFSESLPASVADFVIGCFVYRYYAFYESIEHLLAVNTSNVRIYRFVCHVVDCTIKKAYMQVLDQYLEDELIDDDAHKQAKAHIMGGKYEELYKDFDMSRLMYQDSYGYFSEADFKAGARQFVYQCTSRFEDDALQLLRRVLANKGLIEWKKGSAMFNNLALLRTATGRPSLDTFADAFKEAGFELGMYALDILDFSRLPKAPRAYFLMYRAILLIYISKKDSSASIRLCDHYAELCPSVARFMLETCYQATLGRADPAGDMFGMLQELARMHSFDKQVANKLLYSANTKAVQGSYGAYQLSMLK